MMKRRISAISFIALLLISWLTPILIPISQAQGETKLVRQRLRYGYWEIAPVIDNILTDFTVEHRGQVSMLRDVRTSQEILAGKYTMDVDGNDRGTTINQITNSPTAPLLESPSYHLHSTRSGTDMADTDADPDVALKKTYIWSSAPEVGFSIGQVYLSDPYGNHWATKGYTNYSQALETLSETVTMVNGLQNVTYIYRKIPYSFRIVFWTMGDCEYSSQVGSHEIYSYEEEKVILGIGQSWYEEKDSYDIQYSWVDKVWADIDEAEANLKISIDAPLFTSRATQKITSPDGRTTLFYNNTWVGLMDATVQQIMGGAIDPRVPTTVAYPNGLPTGTVSSTIAKPSRTDLPAQDDYIQGTSRQTVQPAADADEALRNDGFSKEPTVINGDMGSGTPNDQKWGISQYGAPQGVLSPEAMADPDYWLPYMVGTTQATGASLAHPENCYIVSWNDSSQYDPTMNELYPTDYTGAEGNWINSKIINEIQSDQIDRRYSPQLALSEEIPNSLTLNLGARLKPGLHFWTKTLDIDKQDWRREYVFIIGWQNAGLESEAHYQFEVLSGAEVVNVFLTYTISFTLIMIDKFNSNTPLINTNAGDCLNPWISAALHNNTYVDQYKYPVEHYLWYTNYFIWIIIAIVGVIGVIIVRKMMKGRGGGKVEIKQYFGAIPPQQTKASV